jgi:hypothetical protein
VFGVKFLCVENTVCSKDRVIIHDAIISHGTNFFLFINISMRICQGKMSAKEFAVFNS